MPYNQMSSSTDRKHGLPFQHGHAHILAPQARRPANISALQSTVADYVSPFSTDKPHLLTDHHKFKSLAEVLSSYSATEKSDAKDFLRRARKVGPKTVPFSDEEVKHFVEHRGGFNVVNQKGSRGMWKKIARDDMKWCQHPTNKPCSCGQNLKNRYLQLIKEGTTQDGWRMETVTVEDTHDQEHDDPDHEHDTEHEHDHDHETDPELDHHDEEYMSFDMEDSSLDEMPMELAGENLVDLEFTRTTFSASALLTNSFMNLGDESYMMETGMNDLAPSTFFPSQPLQPASASSATANSHKEKRSPSPGPSDSRTGTPSRTDSPSQHHAPHIQTVRVWQTKLPEAAQVASLPANARMPALEIEIGKFHFSTSMGTHSPVPAKRIKDEPLTPEYDSPEILASSSTGHLTRQLSHESMSSPSPAGHVENRPSSASSTGSGVGVLDVKLLYGRQKIEYTLQDGERGHKMDIPFSSLIAACVNEEDDILALEVSSSPEFWEEVPGEPSKNGRRYQRCEDFTKGQAFYHRIHFIQFASRDYLKHLNILASFDPRIRSLPVIDFDTDGRTEFAPLICHNDLENLALIYCIDCAQSFCHDCDEVLHRHPTRRAHFRRPITGPACKKRKTATFDRCRCGTSGALKGSAPLSSCIGKRCPCHSEGRGCRNCGCKGCKNPYNSSSSSGSSNNNNTNFASGGGNSNMQGGSGDGRGSSSTPTSSSVTPLGGSSSNSSLQDAAELMESRPTKSPDDSHVPVRPTVNSTASSGAPHTAHLPSKLGILSSLPSYIMNTGLSRPITPPSPHLDLQQVPSMEGASYHPLP